MSRCCPTFSDLRGPIFVGLLGQTCWTCPTLIMMMMTHRAGGGRPVCAACFPVELPTSWVHPVSDATTPSTPRGCRWRHEPDDVTRRWRHDDDVTRLRMTSRGCRWRHEAMTSLGCRWHHGDVVTRRWRHDDDVTRLRMTSRGCRWRPWGNDVTGLYVTSRRWRHEAVGDVTAMSSRGDDVRTMTSRGYRWRHEAVGDGHEAKRREEEKDRHDGEVDATRAMMDGHVTGNSVPDCHLTAQTAAVRPSANYVLLHVKRVLYDVCHVKPTSDDR